MKEKTCSKDFEEVFQSLIQIQKINISKPRSEKPAYSKPFIWLQTKKMSERLYRSTFIEHTKIYIQNLQIYL